MSQTSVSSTKVASIEKAHPCSNLSLFLLLYISYFRMRLLYVSKLTTFLNCSATFFLSYCVFQDLGTKRIISGGYEIDVMYYLNKDFPKSTCYVVTYLQ